MAKTNKTCGCCDVSKSIAQFYKSPIDGSYLPICKNCLKKKYREYLQKTGKESASLWLCLSEIGIPFIYSIWEKIELSVINANVNTDIVMLYLRTLSESGIIVSGFWDSDTMLDMLIDTNVNREEADENLDIKEQQRIWGKFTTDDGDIDIEAYEYLNQTFEDYTKDILEIDTSLERRYRDVAKAELRKRRADETGDIQEIAKAQDNLKKILDMLKLSDFQTNKKSDIDKHIERVIWTIENVKPAECEDLEKYKDFSHFGSMWKDLTRCVQNLIAGTREYPDIPKGEQ